MILTTPEALPTLRFRLPGDWWVIPLTDRATGLASAMRLIRHRIGTQDDRATLRARLHRDFTAAIDEAITGNGQSLLIAVQIVETVPLPISITVFLPDVAMTPAIGTSGDRVIDVLQQGLEAVSAAGVGDLGEFTRLELAGTFALRTSRLRSLEVGRADARADGEPAGPRTMETLIVDYWLAVPGTKRVLLANFSTSFAQLQEQMVVFFDSIVRAAYWENADSA